MIYFFVTKAHDYTIKTFINHWANDLKKQVRLIHYEGLLHLRRLDPGAFIFSDIERLTENQKSIVNAICQQIRLSSKDSKILNRPLQTLNRFELLRMLHNKGLNQYTIYSAQNIPKNLRYPVFLRKSNDSQGPITDLIQDKETLKRTILQATLNGIDLKELVQIEFCETVCPDGLYRRYSAFRIADQIIPAYIHFNSDWRIKRREPQNEAQRKETLAYLNENPHQDALAEIFQLAGVQYGRVDYSLLDGKPQIWQIATNPILLEPPQQYQPENFPFKQILSNQLESAFASLEIKLAFPENRDIPVWLDFNMLQAE